MDGSGACQDKVPAGDPHGKYKRSPNGIGYYLDVDELLTHEKTKTNLDQLVRASD